MWGGRPRPQPGRLAGLVKSESVLNQHQLHHHRRIRRIAIVPGRGSHRVKSELPGRRDHGGVALRGVGHDSRKSVIPRIRDLPTLQKLAESHALILRQNACRADVERSLDAWIDPVSAQVFLKIHILLESAATHFDIVDQHPVRVADAPIFRPKPIGLAKYLSVERQQAPHFPRRYNSSILSPQPTARPPASASALPPRAYSSMPSQTPRYSVRGSDKGRPPSDGTPARTRLLRPSAWFWADSSQEKRRRCSSAPSSRGRTPYPPKSRRAYRQSSGC